MRCFKLKTGCKVVWRYRWMIQYMFPGFNLLCHCHDLFFQKVSLFLHFGSSCVSKGDIADCTAGAVNILRTCVRGFFILSIFSASSIKMPLHVIYLFIFSDSGCELNPCLLLWEVSDKRTGRLYRTFIWIFTWIKWTMPKCECAKLSADIHCAF